MSKTLFIVFTFALTLGIVWALMSGNDDTALKITAVPAVTQVNGEQRIRILARGGYKPRQVTAKANMASVLEIETKGTYDCSSSVTIPQLRYSNLLPATDITRVAIPANMAKGTLDILCSMGMFRGSIHFES